MPAHSTTSRSKSLVDPALPILARLFIELATLQQGQTWGSPDYRKGYDRAIEDTYRIVANLTATAET